MTHNPNTNKFNMETFVEACQQEMSKKNQDNIRDWDLGNYDRWDIDQTSGKLVFSNSPENGGKIVTCDFQVVGTYSNVSQSWLWAWDNPGIEQHLTTNAKSVRDMGEAHGITHFLQSFDTNKDPGWEFTAIAGKLSNAKGCYRGSISGNAGFMYLTFFNAIV